jgi:hypothetical protein
VVAWAHHPAHPAAGQARFVSGLIGPRLDSSLPLHKDGHWRVDNDIRAARADCRAMDGTTSRARHISRMHHLFPRINFLRTSFNWVELPAKNFHFLNLCAILTKKKF